ncbi:ATP-binding cassette, subfamily F, member 3 [Lachnospiraceae bacterium NE2001]|nr:ATP-binding cassette, subfamily F, member 3 [Lachnospiraceae bacterium NE2001]
MILACQNISKSFGETEVLRNINFHIEKNDKCGLIGINGAGKTTLLRVILGEEEADSGNVVVARDVRLGYLSQTQDTELSNTIYGAMQEAKKYILDMEARIRELEQEMEGKTEEELVPILEAYNRLSTQYDRENGYAYESEITGVIAGLGFTKEDYDRPIASLSGGQKMRVALGRLLLSHPDVIILDEPTNHLDMASIQWLEGYLSSYPGAVIVVSHDRYFIDKITNRIIEIDQGVSQVYNGSYSYYSAEKAKRRQAELNAYIKQQAEIAHEEAVITKLKQFNREKSIKRAESREKKLDKIDRLDKPVEIDTDMRLTLTPVCESGEDVLLAEGLAKSYGDNKLFENLGLDIKRGEHIALIGGNGTGKTTILKILARKLSKDAGTVTLGAKVRIGYFDQEHHDLDTSKTIFEEMSDSFPDMNNTRIRNTLAAFLFTGEDVFKRIGDISGGERGRLSLAKLMLSPANFLILDEPTNHLDIPSKEILEDALRDYTGTVLYVSHDRYFINRTATRILELRDSVLTNYVGDYDYFEEKRDELFAVQHPELVSQYSGLTGQYSGVAGRPTGGVSSDSKLSADVSSNSKLSGASSSRLEYEEQKASAAELRKREKAIKRVENAIEKLETEISEIDSQLNDPANGTDAGLLIELSKKKEEAEAKLEDLYTEWESLQ